MNKQERLGFEFAIVLVETYAAGAIGSRRPHSDLRKATADEIARVLREALAVHERKPAPTGSGGVT